MTLNNLIQATKRLKELIEEQKEQVKAFEDFYLQMLEQQKVKPIIEGVETTQSKIQAEELNNTPY